MRAVNLLPAEARRSGSAGGRSGGAAHALLIGLALLAVAVVTHAATTRDIQSRTAEVAAARSEAAGLEAQTARLARYTTFAQLRANRVGTIASLARSRFPWAQSLRELARTVPSGTWLTSMRATVTPDVSVAGAATDPLRSAVQTPAIELAGCSTSQRAVARLVGDLQRIDGVQRVSLSSSQRPEGDAGAGATLSGQDYVDPCREGSRPQFSLTIFFSQVAA